MSRNTGKIRVIQPELMGIIRPPWSPGLPEGIAVTVAREVVVCTKVIVEVPCTEVTVVKDTTRDTETDGTVTVTVGGKGKGRPPLAERVMVMSTGPVGVGPVPLSLPV